MIKRMKEHIKKRFGKKKKKLKKKEKSFEWKDLEECKFKTGFNRKRKKKIMRKKEGHVLEIEMKI